ATAASATVAARLAGTRLVDREPPAGGIGAVQLLDRPPGLVVVRHLDEAEATRPAAVPVHDDRGRLDRPVPAEHSRQVFVGEAEREVPYVQFHACAPVWLLRADL